MRFFLILLATTIPSVAFAANTNFFGALVPACGVGGAVPCQACDLVKLADNLLKFGVTFSVFGATVMFAYAGVLYVSASANKGNIDSAKDIFVNVFIGLLLVLGAWLIIDLGMRVFTHKPLTFWTNIQCFTAINAGNGISYVPNGNSESVQPTNTPPQLNTTPGSCLDTQTQLRSQVTPSANQASCPAPVNYRDPATAQRDLVQLQKNQTAMNAINSCSGTTGVPKTVIMGIVSIESGGSPTACDPVNGRAANGQCNIGKGGYGMMQVTLAEARRYDPSLNGVSDRDVINKLQSDSNFNVCAGSAALQRYYNDPRSQGDYANAAVAYNGGLDALAASKSCPGYQAYQCPVYDPSVTNTPWCQYTCPYHDSVSNYITAAGGTGG